jgi:hypothetical protein
MTAEQMPFGFRVMDDAREPRRLIDSAVAFSAHAANAPEAESKRTCYLSAFQFGEDFQDFLNAYRSTKGFDGKCWSRYLKFDIDREDITKALADCRRLVAFLVERYSCNNDDLLIFFSGSKGFHIYLPLSLCGSVKPSTVFHKVCRRLAECLAAEAGIPIDTSIYDKVRLFRAPNSKHPKTDLHKVQLTFEELLYQKVESILELAHQPGPFDLPDDPTSCDVGRQDWLAASESMQKEDGYSKQQRNNRGSCTHLNRSTLDFIRQGAEPGHRANRLFAAAANLAEFGCPRALSHELLTEPALDSGLPPREVSRQIDCGFGHSSPSEPSLVANSINQPKNDLNEQLQDLWKEKRA